MTIDDDDNKDAKDQDDDDKDGGDVICQVPRPAWPARQHPPRPLQVLRVGAEGQVPQREEDHQGDPQGERVRNGGRAQVGGGCRKFTIISFPSVP